MPTVRIGQVDYEYPDVYDDILDLVLANSCEGYDREYVPIEVWKTGLRYTQSLSNSTTVDMIPDLWIMTTEREVGHKNKIQ